MRKTIFLASGLILASLVGCGSAADEPAEQIVVRSPGEAPASAGNAAGTAAAADLAARGKIVFAACAACHSVVAGEAAGVGPNLHGIVGRAAGSAKDFGYSGAMKTSGLSWTTAELDAFLADPAAKISGTSMAAGAIADAADRKAVIAYLADSAK